MLHFFVRCETVKMIFELGMMGIRMQEHRSSSYVYTNIFKDGLSLSGNIFTFMESEIYAFLFI